MRNGPFVVHAVAREPTAQMVEDAALGHLREADGGHAERLAVAARGAAPQQEPDRIGMREPGRPAEAAVLAVERLAQDGIARVQSSATERGDVRVALRLR